MAPRDSYGYPLTTGASAADSYNHGVRELLALRTDALAPLAASVVIDPTFALGHAALALLGHELCAHVDVAARLHDAERYAERGTARERSHVHAVSRHLHGDSRPLLAHLDEHPVDALLLSVAVPTIAFAGVTEVPEEAWAVVERSIPAYGDDWWFTGLLAFVRQEQHRFDEAMELSCRSLAEQPTAGHSAHARAHAHYETGDHEAGLAWMDGWVLGPGADSDGRSHFSWHAALHELTLGDLDAVRRRYDSQLRPERGLGCRTLVDTGSLLFRWAVTPGATDVPDLATVAEVTGRQTLERPATPFLAMHGAVTMLALGDVAGLRALSSYAGAHERATFREVVAPLTDALLLMATGDCSRAADRLGALGRSTVRLGGSDAQRELVEEARICALLRADRYDDARVLLDARIDRRRSPRDESWRRQCLPAPGVTPS